MDTGKSVIITGGNGLVGKYLTSLLLENGYSVSHLSRGRGYPGRVKVFSWSPEKQVLDPVVFTGINYVIHLAGANTGKKRWSERRKEEIISSRVSTASLIHDTITKNGIALKAFISASAVGYYGSVTSDRIFKETDPPSDDFLGRTCRKWEESADLFEMSGVRTVKIRAGVVLEKNEGALPRFLNTARFGVFPVLGKGEQYFPWIHIADLCNIYLRAIEDENMKGAYNAVAPDHIINRSFVKTLAKVISRHPLILRVPAFILKLVMGESSVVALEGSRVSSEKLLSTGFKFRFPDLESALRAVMK